VNRLARASGRFLRRHPWQTILTLVGVMLGVAVVVAVDLANASAQRAFELSMQAVGGRASHQLSGGPRGLPDDLFARLRIELGIRPATPVIEGVARVDGETLRLIGIEPFTARAFHDGALALSNELGTSLLTDPVGVLLSADNARRLSLRPGDSFAAEITGRSRQLHLLALLQSDQPAIREGLLIADIATAQELLGRGSWIDRIDLILDQPAATALGQRLPAGTRLQPTAARHAATAEMSRAFQVNLQAMSLLALLVGALLVFNTQTFSVLRRRPLLATLRLVGVTRSGLFRLVLAESLGFGLIGSLLGLALGILVAQQLLQLVTRTINDLYFVLSVTRLLIDPAVLLKGLLLGLGTTLLATVPAAWDAARTHPLQVQRRSGIERQLHQWAPRLVWIGLLLAGAGAGLLLLPTPSLLPAFSGLFALILGCTLGVPLAVLLLLRWVTPLATRLFGPGGRLAARAVGAGLSRSGPAIAALAVAVAATIGIGVMVASFRASVADWLNLTLQSDLYLSAEGEEHAALPAGLAARIGGLPGVLDLSQGRKAQVATAHGDYELLALEPARQSRRGFRFLGDTLPDLWRRFDQGEVVLISEPMSNRSGLAVGSELELRTLAATVRLPVAGVFRDYGSDRGMLVLHRSAYTRWWQDDSVETLGVLLDPAIDRETTLAAIRAELAGWTRPIALNLTDRIREHSLAVFDRTFTITSVLRLLAIGVAFIGILSALMAMQLERARDHAVLRATGMTPGQLLAMAQLETGLMGLLAGLLALPLGWLMAEVLIRVINLRSFGWSMQSLLPPGVFAEALLLAVGSAWLAGLYPALRLTRRQPAMALREE